MDSRLCVLSSPVIQRVLYVCVIVFTRLSGVQCFNVDPDLSSVIGGPGGSYFGFSVGIITDESKYTSIIVGAPLANSSLDPHLRKSGAVYDCGFDGLSSCYQIDFGVDDGGKAHEYHDQLLGFSLDVDPGKPNRITACAPLWKNSRIAQFYFSQGRCYEIGYGKPPTFSVQYSPMKGGRSGDYDKLVLGGTVYMKGLAEGGFTVHYTQDRRGKTELVAGAPGYYEWRGGIAYIDNSTSSMYKPSVLDDTYEADSYNAYSLSSGVFFSDNRVYLVTGSPNYEYKGRVFVVDKDLRLIRLVHAGAQFGSYYGASVCAVDVNGDSYDDLIVGAPLFSSSSATEEGKAYVYLSDGLQFLKQSTSLAGPGHPYGRFGHAIQQLGDVNRDGYNDVVIGAPFVGYSGAIYMYQGSKLGLRSVPSQEILGIAIQSDLRGFGWTFSKATDSDDNQYPDFAVGAVFSDHVVTFRTRPVATVEIGLEISHDVVSADPKCLLEKRLVQCTNILVSFKYTGVNCPSSLEIEFELRGDTLADEEVELGRAQFHEQSGMLTPSIHRVLNLKHGRILRMSYEVFIQTQRDSFTDLGFGLSYKHTSDCRLSKALCPVFDKNLPTKLHKTVSFPKNCGDDGVCVSDLALEAAIPDTLVIGVSTMTIKIILDNLGEAAYLSTVELLFDPDMRIASVSPLVNPPDGPVYCSMNTPSNDNGNSSASCFTGNPLPANSSVQFLVRLDTSNVNPDKNSITVYLKTLTKSDEINTTLSDNSIMKMIVLQRDADITVERSSVPEQLNYRPQSSKTTNTIEDWKRLILSHRYKVVNIGTGTSPEITITVSVPQQDSRGKQLFHLTSYEIVPESDQKSDIVGECRFITDITSGKAVKAKGRQPSPKSFITCENSDCATVSCHLSGLKAGSAAVLHVNGWIQESTFASFKVEGVIKFQTNATVTVDDHPLLKEDSFRSEQFYIRTDLYGHIISPPSLWIPVVAVIVAVILLLLICIILWKIGFFTRPIRDDLKKLMTEECSEHSEMRSLNSPNSDADETVSAGRSGADYEGPVVCSSAGKQVLVTSVGANFVVPVTKDASSHNNQDDYLQCLFVAVPPPDGRHSNEYVDEDELKAYKESRI